MAALVPAIIIYQDVVRTVAYAPRRRRRSRAGGGHWASGCAPSSAARRRPTTHCWLRCARSSPAPSAPTPNWSTAISARRCWRRWRSRTRSSRSTALGGICLHHFTARCSPTRTRRGRARRSSMPSWPCGRRSTPSWLDSFARTTIVLSEGFGAERDSGTLSWRHLRPATAQQNPHAAVLRTS